MKFVSYQDREKAAAGMRTIYTAPTVVAAELASVGFEADFGGQYPGASTCGVGRGMSSSGVWIDLLVQAWSGGSAVLAGLTRLTVFAGNHYRP